MSLRLALVLIALMFSGIAVTSVVAQRQSAKIDGSNNTINQTINELSPAMLEKILKFAELSNKQAELSKKLGIAETALKRFFLDVTDKQIPVEEWPEKLKDLAVRHRELSDRLSRYDGNDPVIAELKAKAKMAIDAGGYRAADRHLAMAELRDLEIAEEMIETADKRFLAAAETRAERAETALLRFGYLEAAKHFEQAYKITPGRYGQRKLVFLIKAGTSYDDSGQYQTALGLKEKAVQLAEQIHGKDHPEVATTLNNLALLYKKLSRYKEAEPIYNRSLAISEKALSKDHPSVAATLNNLANLYRQLSRYREAEPLYKRSLDIKEKALGKDHPTVATTLNNLAELYRQLSRYEEAESLYNRSLAISEKALGKDHPTVAITLNNLAELYRQLSRYKEAELLYKRSLDIKEKVLGKDHPSVAITLNNLALLFKNLNRYEEAETHYKRSQDIKEKVLGKDHPAVATTLNNLALLYYRMSRFEEALPMSRRAVNILTNRLPAGHPDIATVKWVRNAIRAKLGKPQLND